MKLLSSIIIFISFIANLGFAASPGHSDGKPSHEIYFPHTPEREKAVRPEIPILIAPKELETIPAKTEVLLKWQGAAGTESYSLQVSTDADFYVLLINESLFNGTEYNLKELEPGKTYYWRVAAIKSSNIPGHTKSLYKRASFSVE